MAIQKQMQYLKDVDRFILAKKEAIRNFKAIYQCKVGDNYSTNLDPIFRAYIDKNLRKFIDEALALEAEQLKMQHHEAILEAVAFLQEQESFDAT